MTVSAASGASNALGAGPVERALARFALVIGGSRGIGAASSLELARAGYDVAITYHSRATKADSVVEALRSAGSKTSRSYWLDICDNAAVHGLTSSLAATSRMINALVLSASGGLEPGAPDDYAMRINADAPLAAVRALLPAMAPDSCIVYLTSHEAHFWTDETGYAPYRKIAVSKQEGERRLRAQDAAFHACGVRLKIVCADIVEGTATAKLLEHKDPGLLALRRLEAGRLPSVLDVAREVGRRCMENETADVVSYVWDPGARYAPI